MGYDKKDVKQSIYERIGKVTGYSYNDLDDEMYLEADLGFDSIKMITLMNDLIKLIEPDKMEAFSLKYPISSMMAVQTIGDIIEIFEDWYDETNNQNIINHEDSIKQNNTNSDKNSSKQLIVNPNTKQDAYSIISKVTGHLVDDLCDDMYLEADLGLDSIKMITLMNEIMKLVPPELMEEITSKYPISSIMAMQTVGNITEFYEKLIMATNGQNNTNNIPLIEKSG